MKIIASSEMLAKKLNKMNIDVHPIEEISVANHILILRSLEKEVKLSVHLNWSKEISQYERRWDWVKSLVNAVPDQPIILTIKEDKLEITFQY